MYLPTEIRTSISPYSAVELNTTSALANYATEAESGDVREVGIEERKGGRVYGSTKREEEQVANERRLESLVEGSRDDAKLASLASAIDEGSSEALVCHDGSWYRSASQAVPLGKVVTPVSGCRVVLTVVLSGGVTATQGRTSDPHLLPVMTVFTLHLNIKFTPADELGYKTFIAPEFCDLTAREEADIKNLTLKPHLEMEKLVPKLCFFLRN
uniref:(California timema) hypothetical protein n=1 Tax=Timema californicum TaxID=61474 RepID=A0A7R9IWA1_TIMCA|nr:unnamed protein product [Timema californicum]